MRIYEETAACAGPADWPVSTCAYTLTGLPAGDSSGNLLCWTVQIDLAGFEPGADALNVYKLGLISTVVGLLGSLHGTPAILTPLAARLAEATGLLRHLAQVRAQQQHAQHVQIRTPTAGVAPIAHPARVGGRTAAKNGHKARQGLRQQERQAQRIEEQQHAANTASLGYYAPT